MPRFFTGDVNDTHAVIEGEDARHIALSLRMKTGEAITVCDAQGHDYQCVIEQITPARIDLKVTLAEPSAGEPSVEMVLYQALPKGDKMELIVQKAVELGVSRIVPVLTKRCISRPDSKSIHKKLERWNRIALEAAKQCGRGRIPTVDPMMEFAQAVEQMTKDPLALLFYENAEQSMRAALSEKQLTKVSLLIGSEGGIDPAEAQLAAQNGLLTLSLGSRILRCETAPLAALTAILYQAGDI